MLLHHMYIFQAKIPPKCILPPNDQESKYNWRKYKTFDLATVATLSPYFIIFTGWCSASFIGIDMDDNHRGRDRITWHEDFISLFILQQPCSRDKSGIAFLARLATHIYGSTIQRYRCSHCPLFPPERHIHEEWKTGCLCAWLQISFSSQATAIKGGRFNLQMWKATSCCIMKKKVKKSVLNAQISHNYPDSLVLYLG